MKNFFVNKKKKLTLEQARKMMDENNGNLNLSHMEYDELPQGLTVDGYLNLYNTRITSLPIGLSVGGYLDLSHTPITSLPEGLTVDGSLYLDQTSITSLPERITVGGSLNLDHTRITSLPKGLTVGGCLDLSHTPIASLPEGLIVCQTLILSHTPIKNLPERLTVGGSLVLDHTRITSLPEGLSIGRSLYLNYMRIDDIEHGLQKVHYLQDGECVKDKYLFADGILTHIKEKRQVNGYTLYIGKVPGRNVVSDGKNYAHCNKLRDGIADLLFKTAADRGADQYKGMTLDTELPVADLITMYRVATGACRQGTQAFVDSIKNKKGKYTIREVIQLTGRQYGAEKFKEFFFDTPHG